MVARLQAHLHRGESEVIALAAELHANLVVVDEAAGRHELRQRGVAFIGTIGVLIHAKNRGLIPALRAELDRLRACGFYISDQLYQHCLSAVGE